MAPEEVPQFPIVGRGLFVPRWPCHRNGRSRSPTHMDATSSHASSAADDVRSAEQKRRSSTASVSSKSFASSSTITTAISHIVAWPWFLPRLSICKQVNGVAHASYVAIDSVGRYTSTPSRLEPGFCTPQAQSVLVCYDANSLNGLKTLRPGRLKSRSLPVAIVSP